MRFTKSALSYALIIYICAFLSVGPFVNGLSAKIAPKQTDEETGLVTIEKGDTLWDLAAEYFKDPFLWKEFKKYNKFTNPDLIYPKEKLQLPEEILLPAGVARQMENEMIVSMGATKNDIKKLRKEYGKVESELRSTSDNVQSIREVLAELQEENQTLKKQLRQREEKLEELLNKTEKQDIQDEKAQDQIEELRDLLTSQKAEKKSVQKKIKGLKGELSERSKQIEEREVELSQLSKEIKDHRERLAVSQENIVKLREKVEEAEVDYAKEAEKPADEKESKLAVATAIASGVVLFVVGMMAR